MQISPIKIILSWRIDDKEDSRQLEVNEEPIYIGRKTDNQVFLAHSSVSRSHARLLNTAQGLSIQDLNSRYGTFVDGIAVDPDKPQIIHPGAEIRFGSLVVTFNYVHEQHLSRGLVQEFSDFDATVCIDDLRQEILCAIEKKDIAPHAADSFRQSIDQASLKAQKSISVWSRQNALIHSIHLVLNQTHLYQDFLAIILPLIARELKADRGFILKYDDQQKKLISSANYHFQFAMSNNNADSNEIFSQTIARHCYDKNELILIENTLSEKYLDQALSVSELSVKSAVAIPLSYGERTLGVLYLDSQTNIAHFHQSQRSFLQSLQVHTGTALRSAIHYSQAITDDLTGLYTRKFFEARIKQSMEQARRYESSCSLILLDIDHFKQFNDTYGHNFGDRVLKEISELLSDSARKSDVVGRLGGEEFILLLSETNGNGALNYAERLRQDIANLKIIYAKEQVSITASFGVVEYASHFGTMPYRFIEEADVAMYEAKRAGRNQVILAENKIISAVETMYSEQTITD